MPHKQTCHSCDAKGEHWHWEGKPFLSRNYRGPCNSCGGKKFSLIYSQFEVAPLIADWPLARLLRLGAELYWDATCEQPRSQTLYWLKVALQDAVTHRLRFEFKLSEWALHCWYRRIRFAGQPKPWARPRRGRLVA